MLEVAFFDRRNRQDDQYVSRSEFVVDHRTLADIGT